MSQCEPLECRRYTSAFPAAAGVASAPPAAVVARLTYYNGSAADGNDPTVNTADDAAIAPDKAALLPGESASAANVTSFTRGITGIDIDLRSSTPFVGADDFTFRAGNTPDPSIWTDAPVPTAVVVRSGAGAGGSDRVSVTFADGAVRNAWLQVTLAATLDTRLAAPDVFYFGNLVGETGDDPAGAGEALSVTAPDVRRTRAALGRTDADSLRRFDFNRDGVVNVVDLAVVKGNVGRGLPSLTAPPVATPTPAAAAARCAPPRRRAWYDVELGPLG